MFYQRLKGGHHSGFASGVVLWSLASKDNIPQRWKSHAHGRLYVGNVLRATISVWMSACCFRRTPTKGWLVHEIHAKMIRTMLSPFGCFLHGWRSACIVIQYFKVINQPHSIDRYRMPVPLHASHTTESPNTFVGILPLEQRGQGCRRRPTNLATSQPSRWRGHSILQTNRSHTSQLPFELSRPQYSHRLHG